MRGCGFRSGDSFDADMVGHLLAQGSPPLASLPCPFVPGKLVITERIHEGATDRLEDPAAVPLTYQGSR